MRLKLITLMALVITTSSCLQIGSYTEEGEYEVSLGEADKKYVPKTLDHVYDRNYMNLINELIEDKTLAISSDVDLLRIIKAIAWVESTWRHYYEVNGRYFVLLGDDGSSFGIMQIHQQYHGAKPILEENLAYGISYAREKYNRANTSNCASGSNSGSSIVAIARRTYAQYNGGNSAICRNNDRRDDNIESAYLEQPWLDYL